MRTYRKQYILITLFVVLIIIELCVYDYNSGFQWESVLRFTPPTLMILAMMLSIRSTKKKKINSDNTFNYD